MIATLHRLIRIGPDFTVLTRFDTRWDKMVPDNLVVDAAGVIYVGMRVGIARLTPTATSYREEWLFPP